MERQDWLVPILSDSLRHVYQRCILEHVPEILDLITEVWEQLIRIVSVDNLLMATCPHLSRWFCLLMQPSHIPFSSDVLIEAKHKEKNLKFRHSVNVETHKEQSYIAGSETVNGPVFEREKVVVRTRCQAAKLLGLLSTLIIRPIPGLSMQGIELPFESYTKLLLFYLNSKSALQRLAVALVIDEWAKQDKTGLQGLDTVQCKLLESLHECIYYDEIALPFARMHQECRDFTTALKQHESPTEMVLSFPSIITFEQAQKLATTDFENFIINSKLKVKALDVLERKRKSLLFTINQTSQLQTKWSIMVRATLAGAIIAIENLPEKLNPIIKPLMDAIKKEENALLQRKAANSLSHLLELCVDRLVCPNPKIIKNLCAFLTGDSQFTPRIFNCGAANAIQADQEGNSRLVTPIISSSNYFGILTLTSMQKKAERKMILRRTSSVSRGRPPTIDVSLDEPLVDDETQKQVELQRRGAEFALTEMTKQTGNNLPVKIPKLWEAMLHSLVEQMDPSLGVNQIVDNDIQAQELVTCLQVLETVTPFLSPHLHPQFNCEN
uniref:Mot1 central domain-containing protein n=1 Tax=Strigamia maritima TaxID=126957 RepID=T1IQ59_STRMM